MYTQSLNKGVTATLLAVAVMALNAPSANANGRGFYIPPPPMSSAERAQIRKDSERRAAEAADRMAEVYRQNCERTIPQQFICLHGDVIRPTRELVTVETRGRYTGEFLSGSYSGPKVGASALIVNILRKDCSQIRTEKDLATVDVSIEEFFKETSSPNGSIQIEDLNRNEPASETFLTAKVDFRTFSPRVILEDWSPLLGLASRPRLAPASISLELKDSRNVTIWGVRPSVLKTNVDRATETVPQSHLDTGSWWTLREERKGVPLISEGSARVAVYSRCFSQ